MEVNPELFSGMDCHKLKAFDWDFGRKNQAGSYGVLERLNIGIYQKIMALLSHY